MTSSLYNKVLRSSRPDQEVIRKKIIFFVFDHLDIFWEVNRADNFTAQPWNCSVCIDFNVKNLFYLGLSSCNAHYSCMHKTSRKWTPTLLQSVELNDHVHLFLLKYLCVAVSVYKRTYLYTLECMWYMRGMDSCLLVYMHIPEWLSASKNIRPCSVC